MVQFSSQLFGGFVGQICISTVSLAIIDFRKSILAGSDFSNKSAVGDCVPKICVEGVIYDAAIDGRFNCEG